MDYTVLILGVLYLAVVYCVLIYLESGRAKQDPIAGVKGRDYLKDPNKDQTTDFKPAPKNFVYHSTRPAFSRLLWGFLWVLVSFGGYLLTLLFTGSGGYEPGWEILGPVISSIWPLSFAVFGFMLVFPDFQKMRGALLYSLTSRALVIRNTFGRTVIPFALIETVKKDFLIVDEQRMTQTSVMYSYKDSGGSDIKLFRDSWLPQFKGAPYVSKDRGECVVVTLKGCGTSIALTPENLEISQELSNRVTLQPQVD